jgi:hypothetical protein
MVTMTKLAKEELLMEIESLDLCRREFSIEQANKETGRGSYEVREEVARARMERIKSLLEREEEPAKAESVHPSLLRYKVLIVHKNKFLLTVGCLSAGEIEMLRTHHWNYRSPTSSTHNQDNAILIGDYDTEALFISLSEICSIKVMPDEPAEGTGK